MASEVEKSKVPSDTQSNRLTFLLSGSTFSKKQLDEIVKARKEINQWRAK